MRKKRSSSLRYIKSDRSLRFQLLARSLIILAVLLILIGGLQYILMTNFLYKNQAETMVSQLRSFPKDLLDNMSSRQDNNQQMNPPTQDMNGGRRPLLFLPNTSIAYIDQDGNFHDLKDESGMLSPQLSEEIYSGAHQQYTRNQSVPYYITENSEGTEQIVVIIPAGGPNNHGELFQMGMQTKPIREIALNQLLIFALLSLLALSGGLMLYLPVLRRTLNPLEQMVQKVEEINSGNLNHRFSNSLGQSEINQLANSFNGMLERLEDSFEAEREAKEQMRRFIADASHELRTPLTSIHGFLEVLLRGAVNNPDQLYAALNSMHGESTRMKKLIEDLLMLAKLDRAPELNIQQIKLSHVIEEMQPSLKILAQNRTLQYKLNSDDAGQYDRDKMKQVILNLVHNAVQHTDPKQGQITISLSAQYGMIKITVTDNGEGIPAEHLPYVFDRFYRSDTSRTRKRGGAGLGLSISMSIVEAHGGSMSVFSESGKGSTFQVILPLNSEN